jgi:hypothetical protein
MRAKTALTSFLAVAALGVLAGMAAAQDATVEIHTWGGQSLTISQPSFEVFYTIVSRTSQQVESGGGQVGTFGGMQQLGLGLLARQTADPSLITLNRLFGTQAPDTIQGHRQASEITVYREGIAIKIPVDSISSLTFTRQQVIDSPLPPYLAPTHTRSMVVVVLADGTRVDADDANLGTLIVRGLSSAGRVDIPWRDIQTLVFQR